ncbi:MAG TPA: gamma-glutamyltransferase [Acidimicrobiales bacterium]|nr:gamma-glutamyltransferase [Acidimicrobiales bacterium]
MELAPLTTTLAPNGAVCAVDHLASEAGVAMLRAGGSAADAAVAASAVLAVTTQHMCGMGGDLFALVHDGGGAPAALNSSGRAGSGADADRLRADGHRVMPRRGDIRAVPVPGCVDGWIALHTRYGRLPLADVLEPARAYAADGFPASQLLAWACLLLEGLPEAADYTAGGQVDLGTVIRRPGVARTLEAIAAGGRAAFYEGEFGEGLLALGAAEYTGDDLARPLADWVEPLQLEAWGHRLWTIPPNSQGYLTLAGAWIASGLPLPADPADPSWAHLTVEAARQAGFDRRDVLHELADGQALLDARRLAPRRDAIDAERAAALGANVDVGGTIYLCAVDSNRMGVSLIQSNAAGWGSMLIVPGVRIFLQNRGLGFSLERGHPAEYGPGRRPPHTLSPALVTRPDDDTLAMTVGTMGGDSQPQILLQLLARLLHNEQSPADAIAAGRWVLTGPEGGAGFDTWDAGGRVRVAVEGHAPAAWDDGLRTRGHDVVRTGAFNTGFGHAHVIVNRGDHFAAASDPRALGGSAAGY